MVPAHVLPLPSVTVLPELTGTDGACTCVTFSFLCYQSYHMYYLWLTFGYLCYQSLPGTGDACICAWDYSSYADKYLVTLVTW